jgi:hypothetical protein
MVDGAPLMGVLGIEGIGRIERIERIERSGVRHLSIDRHYGLRGF